MLDVYFDKDLVSTLLANKTTTANLGNRYMNKMGLVQYRNKTFSDTKCFINVFSVTEDNLEELMYIDTEKEKENALKQAKK